MPKHYDIAIVGAGIVGIAHAWAAARRGLRTIVIERDSHCIGASVRNFGMVWPIGQPSGNSLDIALESRALWTEFLESTNCWNRPTGSIHAAYRADELAVLEEFADDSASLGYDCRMLTAHQTLEMSSLLKKEGSLGGLYSSTEIGVNPREVVSTAAAWLNEQFGIEFAFGRGVSKIDGRRIMSERECIAEAERVIVCSGRDLQTLYADEFDGADMRLCKLLMMKSAAHATADCGPMIAGGLTLQHYQAFQRCPSLASLKNRIAIETPELNEYGIHVLAAQNQHGEFILGDSHEYFLPNESIPPFDKENIYRLIERELGHLIEFPTMQIEERWRGVYAKCRSDLCFTATPEPNVFICTGLGGAGMTLSFGLAENLWRNQSFFATESTGANAANQSRTQ